MRFQPMPILTVLSLLSIIFLIVLGNWQYERFSSKMAAEASPIRTETPALRDITLLDIGSASVQQVYGVIDGEPVWRAYVPMALETEAEWGLFLFGVTGGPSPTEIATVDVQTSIQSRVLVRDPKSYPRGMFANADDPDNNQWYTFDASGLAEKYGFDVPPTKVFEPVQIDIVSSDDPSRSRQTVNPYAYETPPDPLPAERHFGYALTWWGMAMALLGVYLALHHARGRLRFRSE
ncbi:MAG: SURF1 family cytochrome oxidase biogenesis protein [Pseudomonadota bacterium]